MPLRVSITTVLYNSASHLRQCFTALEADVQDGFAELLAVDNDSPDDSAQIVKSEFTFAKLVTSKKNLGFAGGCNLAWSISKGDYWLLLNPDAVIAEGGVRQLVNWMDKHPEIAAASADIINSDGISTSPGERFPSISLALLEIFRIHLLLPQSFRSRLFQGKYWRGGNQIDTDWIPGTAMIVRRRAIEQVGLLSEEFFMYGEDIEWCWRMKKGNWQIGVCNEVKVTHYKRTSVLQTWGYDETLLRMQSASYKAFGIIHGYWYSNILLLINSLAQIIESYHPLRHKEHRKIAKIQLSVNLAVLMGKDFQTKISNV